MAETEANPEHAFSDAQRRELLRLVAGLRDVIDAAVSLRAPEATLAELADRVEALRGALLPHSGTRPIPRYGSGLHLDDLNAFIPFSPVSGRYSPLAPPVELSTSGDRVVGRVTFANAYEGPPDSVHGAIIAGVYDELLAFANIAGGTPGPTASLTVQYRRPTPLGVELRFEAWTERVEGRKVWARGTCHAGSELLSESEGLFICVDAQQAARMWRGRAAR